LKFIGKTIIPFCVLLLLCLITYFSYLNSVYYSDLHHWGFIASHSRDYISGGLLFKNIFVQYGVGQLILFKFINYIYQINFSNIGIITSFFYCLNFLILYFILKRVSSNLIALSILIVIFFCSPYINYPWPDYIASFCLLLFCFFLLFFKKNKTFTYFFSGFFLFLAIIFRTSYVLNIFSAILVYFYLIKIDKKFYNKNLVNSLFVFLIFFCIYMFYLFLNNTLADWFYQGVGVFRDYVTGSNSVYMSWVIENLGSNFWVLLKILKVLLRFVIQLIIPKNISDFIFLIFFITNLFIIFIFLTKNLKSLSPYLYKINNKLKINEYYNFFIFFSLLGFFGTTQSIFYFVFYKNLNASISLFITVAFLINVMCENNRFKKFLKTFFILIFLISSISLYEAIKKFYSINKSLYFDSNIEYFGKRKFLKYELDYYNLLKQKLCEKDLIILNFSFDSNAPFLCSNQRNFIHFFYYFLNSLDNDLFLRVTNGKLKNNEILITPWFYENDNLKLYYKVLLTEGQIWWGSSSNSKFHYFYKSNNY
jgi:hypothetical protein